MSFKFEKLKVWQKAVDLAADVNDLTRTFPKDELFVLSAQIKRARGLSFTQHCGRVNRTIKSRI